MGWISNDNEHEGGLPALRPMDVYLPRPQAKEGSVKGVSGRYKRDKLMTDYKVVPDAEITGWRGACDCGWQGAMWKRVASPADADFNERRDYVAPDDFADASREVEDAIHDEWKAHIAAPSKAILGVAAAAREHSQAGQRLDKTVAAAKTAGASWADIGRAVGISRN
jgi:hypothetical protein